MMMTNQLMHPLCQLPNYGFQQLPLYIEVLGTRIAY